MAAQVGPAKGGRFDLGQNSEMNVTPFVDVMLVLLIIFMVVAPIATTSIRIDLPPATPPKNDNAKPPTYISINDSGQVYIGGGTLGKSATKLSSMEGMAYDIATSLGVANPTNERVFIRADRHVSYGTFMGVINQLQKDGYYKVGLIAENLGAT
ncbi:MAG TPA: biopolymer transporter ExbD [Caulobacteraceae bacterium]|jgi:biopolymer transport protein ExbD|nr:biopolymer transporter ExbD [Caulobacteraceae bacterium]